jgi:hypothetical protein
MHGLAAHGAAYFHPGRVPFGQHRAGVYRHDCNASPGNEFEQGLLQLLAQIGKILFGLL